LTFFLDNDEELEDIRVAYSTGKMLTGEIKAILCDVICKFVAEFQAKRAKVTDEDVRIFMEERKIDPFPKAWKAEMDKRAADKVNADEEKKKAKEETKAKEGEPKSKE
jgi:tryptophanyl-tRNA synthetase